MVREYRCKGRGTDDTHLEHLCVLYGTLTHRVYQTNMSSAHRDPSRTFLHGISSAITMSRSYDNGPGKRILWMNMIAMVVNEERFRIRSAFQGFISYDLKVIMTNHGVAVLTTCDMQVNINVLVPKTEDSMTKLFEHIMGHIRHTWEEYAIDMRPIRNLVDMPKPYHVQRRVVPSRRCARIIQFVDGVVECMGRHIHPRSIVTDPRDLAGTTPLSRMTWFDDDGVVYWHRFSCGTIVTFDNPKVDMVKVLELPPQLEDGEIIASALTPCCKLFVASLTPRNLGQCLDMMDASWVPPEFRRFSAIVAKAAFGISDQLIVGCGTVLSPPVAMSQRDIVCDMMQVFAVFGEMVSASTRTADRVIVKLVDLVESFDDKLAWRKWSLQSEFLYALVGCATPSRLHRLCQKHTCMYHVTALYLKHNTTWTSEMRKMAQFVSTVDVQSLEEDDPVVEVRSKFERLSVETSMCGRRLMEDEVKCAPRSPSTTTTPVATTHVVTTTDTNEFSVEASTAPATLHDVAKRFHTIVLGSMHECELIGSGVFHDAGDVDVVVGVSGSATLEDAYNVVWTALRTYVETVWTAQYDRVTDEHVSVIRGTFEGHSMDVQVYRTDASDPTEAESMTRRAIQLSKSLSAGITSNHCRDVAWMHTFADAAAWKGHRLCRLSGIAITCIAIVVGQGCNTTNLVSRLRDVIAQETPVLDFDVQQSTTRGGRHRPMSSLVVIVNEMNIATRLTVGITRHLLDTLCMAVQKPSLDPNVYHQWRRRTMVPCLRVRPREVGRTVPLTLHTSLARLDGHPYIDSVYVQDGDDGTLCILVTLDSSASTQRYGFRDTDRLTRVSDTSVLVHRGTLTWTLCCKDASEHHTTPSAWSARDTSVANMVLVDPPYYGACVPNAPFLMLDAMKTFDPFHWLFVDERDGGLTV